MDATGIGRSLLLFPTDVAANEMPIIPTAWTLPYEIVFYLIATSFVTHKKKLFLGIAGCWIAMIVTARVLGTHGNLLIGFITSTLFLEFMMGMIIARLCMNQPHRTRFKPVVAIIVGFILLLFSWVGTNIELATIMMLDRVIKFGIPFSIIVYGCVSLELDDTKEGQRDKNQASYINKVWQLLAESSYSLYLLHYPLLLILSRVGRTVHIPNEVTFVVSAIICVIVGITGYRVIEKPLTSTISSKWGVNGQV